MNKEFEKFMKEFKITSVKIDDDEDDEAKELDFSLLTPHQTDVMNGIIDAINNGERKIILNGSAGVGKTFLVSYLINSLYVTAKRGNLAYITAPTNRAVSVLEEKSKASNGNYWWMQFSTVHKALYMKRVIVEKTGEIYFKPDYKPKGETPFKDGFIIVVDEASMLNSEILFYLESYEYRHIPMIFLGDNKQLNPVNEVDSPIFIRPSLEGKEVELKVDGKSLTHIVPKYLQFSLTEVIRQAEGNPIIQLSNNLPSIGLMEEKILEDGSGYSYTSDYDACVKEVAHHEDYRYLAWTNVEVNKFNFEARKELFFNPSKVEKGEILIFSAPYEGSMQSYSNNAEVKVNSLKIIDGDFVALNKFKPEGEDEFITIKEKLTYYLINNDIKIIHESSEGDLKSIMSRLRNLTKVGLSWKAWFDFSEEFAQVGYRYSTTVHKAQGGTFEKVFINMRDINRNKNIPERKRLWYTAVTRASKRIVFYNHKSYQ
jgi:exodeoxyribonuclease-5